MVSALTVKADVNEEADVNIGDDGKRLPFLQSVVSSVDEDSEVPSKKEDGRDDISVLCVTDNPCVDYGCLGEFRNDLLAQEEASPVSPTTGAPNEKSSETASTDYPTSPKVGSSEAKPTSGDASTESKSEEDGSPFFDTLCSQPYDMFVIATAQQKDEDKSSSQKDESADDDDDASVESTSVVGKMFDDLASLPSLADMGLQLPLIDTSEDADSLLAAVEDLALMSEEDKEETATKSAEVPEAETLNARISSIDSAKLDENLEKELKETDGEEELPSEEEITSDSSYSGSRGGSFPRLRSISSRTEASESTVLTDERPPTEALLKELCAARDEHGRYDVKCANLTSALGDELYKDGEYNKAYGMYKEALSVYSAKLGDHHVTTIDCRIHLGETLEKMGKYDAALQEYHAVREMRKGLNGEKDSTVADTLVMISSALRQKEGRIPQALKELKRALKLYRTSLGDSNPKVATTVDDIASLYMMSGNFVKAAAILDEVVKLKAATSGMFNADVAATLTQLAIAQQSAGDNENTLKSLKKAYSIYTSVDGEDAEETTAALQRLTRFYMESGDYQKATNTCMGVLNRKKRALGNADPSLADIYLDLGVCLQQTGDLNKATKCLKLALTLCIAAKDKEMRDSGTVAHIMHELGTIHELNGRTKDAVKVFKQELVVRRKMGPSKLPQVARTLFYLGTAKYDLGEYTPALSFLTEALGIYETLKDDMGMDFAETLFSTGLVFKTTQHDERAREAFLESLKLFYAHGLGQDHELVKMATSKLKELGHKCECQNQVCTQVPCQSAFGGIKC